MKQGRLHYEALVMGASAGGMQHIRALLLALPPDFPLATVVVVHVAERFDERWVRHLDQLAAVRVKEAEEKEPLLPGHVYLAPGDYHLLVEADRSFSLSTEERVNFARPSIDVLFGTAADAYGPDLVGVVLSGGSADGALGLKHINQRGGLTVVQDPATAEAPAMPLAAMQACPPDHLLSPAAMLQLLIHIHREQCPTS